MTEQARPISPARMALDLLLAGSDPHMVAIWLWAQTLREAGIGQ
jgi:hypothetical protein